MLLVVFGAGASFDSSRNFPDDHPGVARPPLAKDLVNPEFGYLAARIPGSRVVVDEIRRLRTADTATSLETQLTRIAAAAGETPEGRQQLMAFRFYLHSVIDKSVSDWLELTNGFTNYLTLLSYLQRWQHSTATPIRLVTFNYDVMLDRAAEEVFAGWRLSGSLEGYAQRADCRLFKLHGSTSWARSFRVPVPVHAPMVPRALELAAQGQPDRGLTIPAMAIPLVEKMAFECPDDHVQKLRDDLPAVKHVLIIGWRAAEQHALHLLRGEGDARQGLFPSYSLGIVDRGDAGVEEVRTNLDDVGRKGRFLLGETGGFTALINTLDEQLGPFLASGY
jgi:hypothetical protein